MPTAPAFIDRILSGEFFTCVWVFAISIWAGVVNVWRQRHDEPSSPRSIASGPPASGTVLFNMAARAARANASNPRVLLRVV